jgi:adenine-specific DNA-methyltransferase
MLLKKERGQYFTTNKDLQNVLVSFIKNNPKEILEPSVGAGHLVNAVKEVYENILFDCYEIDDTIDFLILKDDIIFKDFLKAGINKKYTTIIGNPPYVKSKKGNLYIKFIEKCTDLLDDGGEMIFIIPSDFFKLTSASTLINKMVSIGNFTDIYHPSSESLFENANINILIFRYVKSKELSDKIIYNNQDMFITNSQGTLTFVKNKNSFKYKIGDLYDVFVGMVSGKESVFRNEELGNILVLQGEDNICKYIFIDKFPSGDEKIDEYMIKNKECLMDRKIKKINENNWFEWGALRNVKVIENKKGEECIYVKNITRDKNIAFKGTVGYFGGGLIMLIPKDKIVNNIHLNYINSEEYINQFRYSGRFKIGHKQLKDSYIPN